MKSVIHKCVTCKRHEGKSYQIPPTAALPDFRVTPSAPFDQTACDFAGPLFYKSSGEDRSNKCYIALFTCCATRSVHLELVTDLTAECFIRCFRRFSARRGLATRIVSDNAKTFKTADRKLAALFDLPDVQNYLLNQRIEWRYNLPKASWWGGLFERLVGMTKRCLKKIIGKARLSYDELFTAVTEVEGILNSRPLTYVQSDDIE